MNTVLDDKVKELNAAICGRVGSHSIHAEAVCVEVSRNKETININEKDEPVFFDDKVDIYLYHKKQGISFTINRARGKNVTYYAKAQVILYCCCSPRNFHEALVGIMSKFNHLEVSDIDFDQSKILRAETGAKDFDHSNKNIFALKYFIYYFTDKCDDVCLS